FGCPLVEAIYQGPLPGFGPLVDGKLAIDRVVKRLHPAIRVGWDIPVQGNRIDIRQFYSGGVQTELQRLDRIRTPSVFLTTKAFLLGVGDDFPVLHDRNGRVGVTFKNTKIKSRGHQETGRLDSHDVVSAIDVDSFASDAGREVADEK